MALPALVLIDIQKGFHDPYWGRRNNPDFEATIANLLAQWRQRAWPVFHVQHLSTELLSPLRPDRPGAAFMDFAVPCPGESVTTKQVNSAFIGTDLEARLRQAGHRRLCLAGLTTDHCVSTSARMAANLGFEVVMTPETTATFDRQGPDGVVYKAETIHAVHLASLHREFAQVVPVGDVLLFAGRHS